MKNIFTNKKIYLIDFGTCCPKLTKIDDLTDILEGDMFKIL